jgi:hypothetical protein
MTLTSGISVMLFRRRSQTRGSAATVGAERDQLAIEDGLGRQFSQLGNELGDVPAASASDAGLAAGADDRTEAVPLQIEGVAAARGERPGTSEHRGRQSHTI